MVRITILILSLIFLNSLNSQDKLTHIDKDIIIDCNYSFSDAVKGIEIPKYILKQLTIINVEYYSFDKKLHRGQLVVNKSVKKDLLEIFEIIKKTKFPIDKVIPIVKYNWLDTASMKDNNTSAFNYRKVAGQRVLSPHAYGLAIDINPMQNPHINRRKVSPANAVYNPKVDGTIANDSRVVIEFRKRGWAWGGFWKSSKDYQHFEKQ